MVTARMKKGKKVKKSYVAGSVVLQEGTSATFTIAELLILITHYILHGHIRGIILFHMLMGIGELIIKSVVIF